MKKVVVIKVRNMRKRITKYVQLMTQNDIEQLAAFLAQTKFTKIPKHVSIVVNGLVAGDGNLLVSHDGKVDG